MSSIINILTASSKKKLPRECDTAWPYLSLNHISIYFLILARKWLKITIYYVCRLQVSVSPSKVQCSASSSSTMPNGAVTSKPKSWNGDSSIASTSLVWRYCVCGRPPYRPYLRSGACETLRKKNSIWRSFALREMMISVTGWHHTEGTRNGRMPTSKWICTFVIGYEWFNKKLEARCQLGNESVYSGLVMNGSWRELPRCQLCCRQQGRRSTNDDKVGLKITFGFQCVILLRTWK